MVEDSEVTLQTRAASAGCSYFGVRIARHVRRDMADLAARGYSGVLHTFSENDFAYYRGTMREIVEASHAVGLAVQGCPWGLGRTFGGEAESRFVTFHPDECQVLDDGRRIAGACLNSPGYRAFCKEWAEWLLECGVDSVFWDEPAWMVPEHVGIEDASRWTCRCHHCAERHGVRSQLWVPCFGLTKEEIPELDAAIAAAREEGVDDLWTWSYEACGHMTSLATPDSALVWEAVSVALTGRPALETRTTRELVTLLNVEDATVAGAVAEAGDALAGAIEQIAARVAGGGRLVYVGAGTSGRLAALDAAECGPTFGLPPGEVVAVVAGDGEDAEDDAERGAADVRALGVGVKDAVVAVSASGSTPYTLAALESA